MMEPLPRAILFGFEGALVDEAGLRFEVMNGVLAEEGVALSPSDPRVEAFAPPYEEWLASVIVRSPSANDGLLAARLMARASSRYQARLRESDPAWLTGATDFINSVAECGVTLGLVASASRDRVERALGAAGADGRFRVIVAAEDTEEADARLDAYRLALGRLNSRPPLPDRLIHPHEVASVEATVAGLRAAAAAGLRTIALGAGPFEGVEPELRCVGYGELRVLPAGLERLG